MRDVLGRFVDHRCNSDTKDIGMQVANENRTVPPWHDWRVGTPDEAVTMWRKHREAVLWYLADIERVRAVPSGQSVPSDAPHEVYDWLVLLREHAARYGRTSPHEGELCPQGEQWLDTIEVRARAHLAFIDETLAGYGAAAVHGPE